MKISLVNFKNFNCSFLGETKRVKSDELKEIEYEDAKIVDYSKLKTFWGERKYINKDFRKVQRAIFNSRFGLKDLKGYPKMRISYYDKLYDYPVAFALSVIKKDKRGHDTHIIEEIPQIFEGMDKKKVCETLDMLCSVLGDEDVLLDMEGREIKIEKLGKSGLYGKVYKMSSEDCPPLAFKVYDNPGLIGIHGSFGEIGVERAFSRMEVSDVPKFYMGSPLGKKIIKKGESEPTSYACWKLSEFISEDSPLKEGRSFQEVLIGKCLRHADLSTNNVIGQYCIDLGGIINLDYDGFYGNYGYGNSSLIKMMIEKPSVKREILKNQKNQNI